MRNSRYGFSGRFKACLTTALLTFYAIVILSIFIILLLEGGVYIYENLVWLICVEIAITVGVIALAVDRFIRDLRE